jgi:hypothetical protein
MKTLTIAWNTGRLYQRDGQKIAARVSDDGKHIFFADDSRKVDGVFPIARAPKDAYTLRALVTTAYDYDNYNNARHADVRDLYEAAREHAPDLALAGSRTVTLEGNK